VTRLTCAGPAALTTRRVRPRSWQVPTTGSRAEQSRAWGQLDAVDAPQIRSGSATDAAIESEGGAAHPDRARKWPEAYQRTG